MCIRDRLGTASFSFAALDADITGLNLRKDQVDFGTDLAPAETSVVVTEAPKLTIRDASVNEDDGTATLVIAMDVQRSLDVSGTFATSDGTATSPADYAADDGSPFTITAGELQTTIDITLVDDEIHEAGTEDFMVTITGPSDTNIASVEDADAIVTITDDEDPPVLTVADAALTVSESAGTVDITVNMDRASSQDVEVTFTVAAGDTNPAQAADVTGGFTARTETIPAGMTTVTHAVGIVTDTATETPDETFKVTITGPGVSTATVGTAAETVVTITDLKVLSLVVRNSAGVEIDELTETAASGATLTLAVSVSEALVAADGDLTVAFGITVPSGLTDITAPSDIVFDADTGEGTTEKTATITIPADIQNTVVETAGSERAYTFTAMPTISTGVANIDAVKTVNIIDDDSSLSIAAGSREISVEEGETVNVVVSRTGSTALPVSGTYSLTPGSAGVVDGTLIRSAGDDDYTNPAVSARTFLIPAGEEEATISVVTLDDDVVESSEEISLIIASTADITGSLSLITVTDNDDVELVLSANPAGTPANGEVTITGTLSKEIEGFEGFTDSSRSITFTSADASPSLDLVFTDDDPENGILSGDELTASTTWAATSTTQFSFSATSTAITNIGLTEADVTTGDANNPAQVTVSVVPSIFVDSGDREQTVDEDFGAVEVEIRLTPGNTAPAGGISGTYTLAPAATDPASAADYTDAGDGTFTIAERQRDTTVSVNIVDDNLQEGVENFILTIAVDAADTSKAAVDMDGATATITINASDTLFVQFSARDYSVTETETDQDLELTIQTGAVPAEGFTVPVRVTPQRIRNGSEATEDDDYTAVTEATIAAGETEHTLTLSVKGDSVIEGNQGFQVSLLADPDEDLDACLLYTS
ncbi:MAG: hypothetical protein MPK62_05650, partial [Alphaproteobacteria bacterium]|nr:hypothetical protein [Alphaproteobacteria bacterium]